MAYVKAEKWQMEFQKLRNEVVEEATLFNRTWLESKLEDLAQLR